ncbi:diaminobutyrate acetyltransferase [Photobacterium sp.]|uniref:diaminobutyrate acetyltransferase n=1 Tax=Photobacterium sp. TaxID=660 RepID=UPI00299F2359|nr:diaminobutyrate acetyltransferase [Photobacterium sp.]MDX1301295.1 diaminobutyrate acetyltransferase [Photobacterium sp.]
MITTAPWIVSSATLTKDEYKWVFRAPNIGDGDQVHKLIAACSPLDVNSSYCNFLQSTHFRQTCIIAECNDEIAGFISSYLKPENNRELFVWQVAVAPKYRGKGLAFHMLKELLMRDSLEQVKAVETTITKDNQGSWSLFKKLDKANDSQGSVTTFLDEHKHFKGKHDTEYLYRIPLSNTH